MPRKKKTSKKRARAIAVPDHPLYIALKASEVATKLLQGDDNLYIGPERPHPHHTQGLSLKWVDVAWWESQVDAIFQAVTANASLTGELLMPGTHRQLVRLLRWILKNDYPKDPTYIQWQRPGMGLLFWERDLTGERRRGLHPPLHPAPLYPGIDYPVVGVHVEIGSSA